MRIPKKYFQDRVVLLLLSMNTFLTLFNSVLVLLWLDSRSGDGYIVRYWSNRRLDDSSYGNTFEVLSFVALAAFILFFHAVLSMKIYDARRHFAVAILGFGLLLLVLMAMVILNFLINLQ